MTGSEIRIGNWLLNFLKQPFQVNADTIKAFYGGPGAQYPLPTPIPLAPEVLKNAGWRKGTENFWHLRGWQGWIIDKDAAGNLFLIKGEKVIVKYLHELQNLFFAHTKTELEITLP